MLSEPRRKKQRISDDPNNLRWSKDNEKLGQKMLEKMGWRSGTGLGTNEQGRHNPLPIQANVGFKGLGCEVKKDYDVHCEHRRNFDVLLQSLKPSCEESGSKGRGGNEDVSARCSLASLSKSSRRRIHYPRHTKGKDVSTASAMDLATVTGDHDNYIEPHAIREPDVEQTDSKPVVDDTNQEEEDSVKGYMKKQFRTSFVKSKAK